MLIKTTSVRNNLLISIIIPCYNDALYVEQSVNSALNQSYPNIEVIVVDDGSNKETKEILKQLEPKITKLLTQENQGQSKARNVGIDASKGDYIFVLDSDDFMESKLIEKAVQLIDDADAKIVCCFATIILDDNSKSIYKPAGGTIKDFLFANNALGSVLFKKSDWTKILGYDEFMRRGFEDWEFYIRLLKNGGRAEVIQELLFNYRKRRFSTTAIANKKKYELLKYIFCKHKDLYKENFEEMITYLLDAAYDNRKNELKRIKSIDFRIGYLLLRPLRFIKRFFNK